MRLVVVLLGTLLGGGIATVLSHGIALLLLGVLIGGLAGMVVANALRGRRTSSAATLSGLSDDD